ncbi:hypothetical protein SCOR_30560 [Sulfidibacter corallicola]
MSPFGRLELVGVPVPTRACSRLWVSPFELVGVSIPVCHSNFWVSPFQAAGQSGLAADYGCPHSAHSDVPKLWVSPFELVGVPIPGLQPMMGVPIRIWRIRLPGFRIFGCPHSNWWVSPFRSATRIFGCPHSRRQANQDLQPIMGVPIPMFHSANQGLQPIMGVPIRTGGCPHPDVTRIYGCPHSNWLPGFRIFGCPHLNWWVSPFRASAADYGCPHSNWWVSPFRASTRIYGCPHSNYPFELWVSSFRRIGLRIGGCPHSGLPGSESVGVPIPGSFIPIRTPFEPGGCPHPGLGTNRTGTGRPPARFG